MTAIRLVPCGEAVLVRLVGGAAARAGADLAQQADQVGLRDLRALGQVVATLEGVAREPARGLAHADRRAARAGVDLGLRQGVRGAGGLPEESCGGAESGGDPVSERHLPSIWATGVACQDRFVGPVRQPIRRAANPLVKSVGIENNRRRMARIFEDNSRSIGGTPLIHLRRIAAGRQGPRARQDRGPQPGLLGQVPHRRLDDLRRREARRAPAGHRGHRADQRQHRHRAGVRVRVARLPADPDDAGDHEPRAPQGAGGVRRQPGAHARRRGHDGRDRQGRGDRRRPTRSAT